MILNKYCKRIIKFISVIIRIIVYPIIYFMNKEERKYIPVIKEPLLLYSATKLADKIRRGVIRSEDVIRAYIQRCIQINPIINAIVDTRYETALMDAKNVDKLLSQKSYTLNELEKLYPLLGVPITIKESFALKGMSHNCGVYKEFKNIASFDAKVVMQIKSAGAIPLLVSNTPELCLCWETFNYVTGTTKNPYDTTKTSGGSSGGEASLMSSAASVIGIGSDTAGSLRLPAMYNGIFAHKPTTKYVSSEGHKPDIRTKCLSKISSVGPIARYAEDLPLLLRIMKDPLAENLNPNVKVSLDSIKLYYMEGDDSDMVTNINSDVKTAIEKVIRYFEDVRGIKIKKANLKHMKHASDMSIILAMNVRDLESVFEQPFKLSSLAIEVVKKLLGCSKLSTTSIGHAYMRKARDYIGDNTFKEYTEVSAKLRQEFMDLLQDNGVCFYPTFPRTASMHYDYVRQLLDFSYLMIFNTLSLPVTSCPVGLASNGMPVGVQVISSPGCDHLSLLIAQEMEKAFGGWIPPPMF